MSDLQRIVAQLQYESIGPQVGDCIYLPLRTDSIKLKLNLTKVFKEAKDGKCYISRIRKDLSGETILVLGPERGRVSTAFKLNELIKHDDLKLFENEEGIK